jgi:hypothetical protein
MTTIDLTPDRVALRSLLELHVPTWDDDDVYAGCGCGWTGTGEISMQPQHQADVLVAAGFRQAHDPFCQLCGRQGHDKIDRPCLRCHQ